MATITIHDEPTRAAAWKALWGTAGSDLDGENFANLFHETGWQPINVEFGVASDADPGRLLHEQFEQLDRVRSAATAIAVAEVGSTVTLPLEANDLAAALDDCVTWIQDEQSGFWQMGDTDREWAIRCRDAAARLLSEFAPTESVA